MPPVVAARLSWRRPAPCAEQNRHTGAGRPDGHTRVQPARVAPAGQPAGGRGVSGAADWCSRPRTGPFPRRPVDGDTRAQAPAPAPRTPPLVAPWATATDGGA